MKASLMKSAALAALITLFALCSCGGETAPGETTTPASNQTTQVPVESKPVQEKGRLTLVSEGKSLFTVVRAENASDREIQAAKTIREQAETLCGVPLELGTDYLGVSEKETATERLEILVGSVDREESRALAQDLPERCFAIQTTDSKVVIAAGDELTLEEGVRYFCAHYLSGDAVESGEGSLVLAAQIDYVSEPYDYLAALLPTADTFTSVCAKAYSIAAPSETMGTPQGGYTDGKYMYQLFIARDWENNEKNNIDRIVKTDLATGEVVKVSGDLSLNHGNDITYNPKLNALIVVHNNPNRNKISLIDPDTLELIETKNIAFQIYSISYNASRDLYVVGLSGGQAFRFLDADFKAVELKAIYPPTPRTNGYITQGVASDDNYIYFVLYKENVITVYDWEGQFVTLIELTVGNVEPENISVVGNMIYVNTTGGGATVYRVVPEKKK